VSVRSSHQTVSDYTGTPAHVNDFQTLNNLGSLQPVGASKKIVLPSVLIVFHPLLCETYRVIQQF